MLKAIATAFGQASEEDAQNCRQVEAELRGKVPVVQAEPSEAVAETMGMVAESTERGEVSETPASEEKPSAEGPAPAYEEQPQKLVAAVVTCKGCQQRITRGTMVVKRAEGYYHPDCVTSVAGVTASG